MMSTEVTLRLRRPIESTLAAGHPWVWSASVDPFTAAPGDIARVVDARGRFVARAVVDGAELAARVWTTRDERLDEGMLSARVRAACALRDRVVPAETEAYRLLHGEGDLTPGYVCDVYGRWAVLSVDGAGATARVDAMVGPLRAVLAARGVEALLLRTRRKGEGHEVRALYGDAPDGVIAVKERGMTLRADLTRGQKTGLFLDQRESRWRVRRLARGMRVLNLYAYTGGFSAAAGLGDATSVTSVDVAPAAVALATETWAANGLDPAAHEAVAADVPEWLAEARRRGARYDMVIADPPSFAPREAAVPAALKSYAALHAAAMSVVAPGGYYLAGSCSSHVDRARFAATLLEGASKARRTTQLLDFWGAPEDHPRLLAFPEGDYLKNTLLRMG